LLTGAGWAALLTAVLIPIQIVIFMRYAFPETVEGWFGLLQDNALAGLVNLDLLLVVVNVLLIGIVLALYVVLRPISRSVITVAAALSFLSIAVYVMINPAIQMLGLSDQFALATGDSERLTVLAAGQGLLASWEGTAFHVAYIVGQIAGILIGLVMLRSHLFGKLVPYALIAGNVLGFAFYLPTVGLALSALSGVVLWLWYILIIPKFFRLARGAAEFRPGSPGVELRATELVGRS
jgi:hypothetical protein